MSASPNEKRPIGQDDAKEKGSNSSSTSTVPVQDEQRLPPVSFHKLFQVRILLVRNLSSSIDGTSILPN